MLYCTLRYNRLINCVTVLISRIKTAELLRNTQIHISNSKASLRVLLCRGDDFLNIWSNVSGIDCERTLDFISTQLGYWLFLILKSFIKLDLLCDQVTGEWAISEHLSKLASFHDYDLTSTIQASGSAQVAMDLWQQNRMLYS